jgi:hypothetical protein
MSMAQLSSLLVAASLLLAATDRSVVAEPLFDGTTFTGWEGDTAHVWRIENGEIVAGSLDRRQEKNDFLCTKKRYGNFDLRLKIKLAGSEGFVNSGIQFRSERIPESHELIGYQADFGKGFDGALYDESRRNRILAQPSGDVLAKVSRPGEWHDYRIRAEGPRVQLWVNDIQTVDYTETESGLPAEGVIALQIHGNAVSEVRFKAIDIEELPPTGAAALGADMPKRLPRAESFLGIHYDFHAGKDCNEIGKNTTRKMIENIIDQVRPDYIQIDCKGHAGLSSYPTKVGNPAPGFVGDPLKVWRQVTAERGVALFMHYSGVWDSEAIRLHPEWGAINADGKVQGKATSFFGPYADTLLIPQLRELAGEYGVDGVWVDGECWASVPDYGEAAVKAFREATSIADVPRKPGDPHWFELLEFHREAFRNYLRHYIAEVKKTNPNFQICSNWAFTDHMAEKVNVPLDFLSGDYAPDDSVNSARLSARYLARQGMPWDLMAWSFSRNKGKDGSNQKTAVQKTAVQIEREAAIVLAAGGGFQAYFKQKRDGSVYDERVPVMAEVAKFCRARQAVCHRSEAVPQIGLLLSTAGHYRSINGLFNRNLNMVHGTLQALVESQQSVEVVGEHQLAGRMGEYPLIIVPEWAYLDTTFRDELAAYAREGGSLLLIGPGPAALFEKELQGTKPGAVATIGKGRIAVLPENFSQRYLSKREKATRDPLIALVRQLFPNPMVEVTGSEDVEITVAKNHGKLLVNLVNVSGPHQTEPVTDSIAPIGPVKLTIRMASRPSAITIEPAGTPLPFAFAAGEVSLTVPRVEVHEIVVIEGGQK